MPTRPRLLSVKRKQKAWVRKSDYKSLYNYRWQKARRNFLLSNPLCRPCERRKRVAPANEVDHITPHRGDLGLFWDRDNWQPICGNCHKEKSRTDNARPRLKPIGLGKSLSPLTIVCGPPGGGKNYYVDKHKSHRDLIIDLDEYKKEAKNVEQALRLRNTQLYNLSRERYSHVWFIITAPMQTDRDWWRKTLGADRVLIIETPPEVCKQNIITDAAKADIVEDRIKWSLKWWKQYSTSGQDETIGVGGINP